MVRTDTMVNDNLNQLVPNIWINVTKQSGPPPLAGQQMVYDGISGRFFMFGGQSLYLTSGDMWSFEPYSMVWRLVNISGAKPAPRADETFVCVCYDNSSNDNFILMFGGWYNNSQGVVGRYSDTWLFFPSNSTWLELNESIHPSARSDAAAAFDPEDRIILLYGGYNGTYLDDAWQFSLATLSWNRIDLNDPVRPPPLADARMAYDTAQRVFLMFGGNNNLNPNEQYNHYNDIYAFYPSNLSWKHLNPMNQPAKRDYSVFIYDSRDDLFLMEGGYDDDVALGDTWLYSYNTNSWIQLSDANVKPARFASSFSYDYKDNIILLYGGAFNDTAYSDTLILKLNLQSNATISWYPKNPRVGQSVVFSTYLYDDPIPPLAFKWIIDNKYVSNISSFSYVFDSQGEKSVRVQVIDQLGLTHVGAAQLNVVSASFAELSIMISIIIICSVATLIALLLYAFRKSGRF